MRSAFILAVIILTLAAAPAGAQIILPSGGSGGGGSGCSVSGTQFQILAVNSAGTGCTPDANAMVNAGALTLGASGTSGTMIFGNATSGTVTLGTVTGALGTVTASLPANTGTVAELNLAQTFSAVQTFNANDLLLGGVTGGGTQCLQASNTGVVTGTGSGCGGGTPGGANTDVQFNSSSAFGGDAGFTYAGNGQATLALGSITTNLKALNITGTWNAGGTSFDAPLFMNITNTASANPSYLVDVQLGGVSQFLVRSNGNGTFAGNVITAGTVTAPNGVISTNNWNFIPAGDGQFEFQEWNNSFASFLTVTANATFQLGRSDAAAPAAQNISVQSVVAGTSNTAGANLTIIGSRSTGTGVSGNLIFEAGKTGTTGSTQNTAYPLLTLNAGNATGATVQLGDGTNFTTYDSCTALTTGATGVIACTGSAMRFKDIHGMISEDQAAVGLDKLNVGTWTYKPEYQTQFGGPAEHVSLYADDVEKMDPRCVTYDETGKVHDYYDRCVIAYLVEDRQNMKAEIEDLKRRVR